MGYKQNLHPEPFQVTLLTDNLTLNENDGSVTITASLSAAASENTTIILTTSNTSTATRNVDYTLSADNLTIVAGSLSTSTTLNTINDNLTEGNETILIEITSISGGNGASENGTQLVSISIIDNDNQTSHSSDLDSNLITLLTTGNCQGCDLSGIFFDGNDNQTADNITSVNLSNANLTNATLQNIQFEGDNFSQARLDNTSLQNVFFAGVDLDGVIGSGVTISESLLFGIFIDHAELPLSQFDNSSFLYSSITYSNLDNSSFVATGLYNTSLDNVSLLGADIRGLYFDNATGSNLDNVSCDNTTLMPNNLTCNTGVLAFNTNLVDDHSNSFDNATGIGLG